MGRYVRRERSVVFDPRSELDGLVFPDHGPPSLYMFPRGPSSNEIGSEGGRELDGPPARHRMYDCLYDSVAEK